MINSKDMKNNIKELLVESTSIPYVVGNGIITNTKIGFDKKKLEEKKKEIATILQELGIDEHPMIRLSSLMTLKNGKTWNELQTFEDFQALDLLLACSNACGFIDNNENIIQLNINEIGGISSVLISVYGRSMINDDEKWLRLIRETVVDKMFFITNAENIKAFANGNQELTEATAHKHK